MFRALFKKEFKSVWGWIPAIFIINLILIRNFLEKDFLDYPITWAILGDYFLYINVIISMIIGFTQSAMEHIRNTRQFLMFRPAPASLIINAKIFSGLTVITIPLFLALIRLLYAITNPEIMPSPWRWNMLSHFFLVYLIICVFYFGALLVGADYRSKWFGMKLAGLFLSITAYFEILYGSQSFTAAFIIFIVFLILVVSRLLQIYKNKKPHSAVSRIPKLLIDVCAFAAVFIYILGQYILENKYSYNDVYIDFKNQIVIRNYLSFQDDRYIYYNENNEELKDYSYNKIFDWMSYYEPADLTKPYKRNLAYQGYDYYTNLISEKDKKNKNIWYYIFADKIFEVYSISGNDAGIRENKFIGYFGRNGINTDKEQAGVLHNYSKQLNVYYLENMIDTEQKSSFFLTPQAVYKINTDNFSISKIRDFSKIKYDFFSFIDKKIFTGDNSKTIPGYMIFTDKNSNKIRLANILEPSKDTEIDLPEFSKDVTEIKITVTSNDTFYIIMTEKLDKNTKRFLIYKKENNEAVALIKTLERTTENYWQSEFKRHLLNQAGIKIYVNFINILNDNMSFDTSLFHHRNGLFTNKRTIISYFAGALFFIILFFADMRKYRYNFSNKLLWIIMALILPYFFPFVYLAREKKEIDNFPLLAGNTRI